LASAADVFLTGGGNLVDNLRRLRIDDSRVVTSLRALLQDVVIARSR
jgi:hypothetical protein